MEPVAPVKHKSSKMRPPPPPPPPPPLPEEEEEGQAGPSVPRAPPGLQQAAQNGTTDGGYEGGRPPPPPVPPGGFRSDSAPSQPASAPAADSEEAEEEKDKSWRKQEPVFAPHIDKEAIERGLRDGTLIRGVLRINSAKPGTAYVQPDGCKARENDLYIRGRAARNRAVHGDIVIVERGTEGDAALRAGAAAGADDIGVDAAVAEEGIIRPPPGLGGSDSGSSDDDEVVFKGAVFAQEDGSEAGRPQKSNRRGRKGEGKGKAQKMDHAIVVAIADPKGRDRAMVCTLHPNPKKVKRQEGEEEDERAPEMVLEGDNVVRAIPTDSRMPWVLIQVNEVTKNILRLPGKLDKYKLWPVQIVKWNETSHLPLGRLKGECLGQAGDLEAEERHALIEHEIDSHDVDFPDELQDEVDEIVRKADADFENEAARRMDLRKKRIFTIDPATARDLDDAIHVDELPGGQQVEIGVHIADVGHFLKLGSIADKEAQKRTTSIYLINRVIPMLPHALCNHLCSLNPNEPKVSFSVFFRLWRETGELVEDVAPWFHKTVMSSVCRLNYDEVQELLDSDNRELEQPPQVYAGFTWDQIKHDIFLLKDVCGKVRHGRLHNGALSITKAKMIFHTRESEDGVPTGYHLEEHCASHWIIEELMLLGNRCVAKHLAHSVVKDSAVLRNHKAPDVKKAEPLEKLMRGNLGLEWDGSSAGAIHVCCQKIYERYGDILGQSVEMMVMRCGMQQAEYFVVNGTENPHHFALNFDYYTHFTSPIRRYPDVMVHRAVAALLGDPSEYQESDVALEQVGICNEKRSASRKCQEQLDRAIFCIYLRKRKQWFYTEGTVLAMKEDQKSGKDMVTVYSPQLGKEKKVLLLSKSEAQKLELYKDLNEDDELLLPDNWKFAGKGAVDLVWSNPDSPEEKRKQTLKVFSCVPIVIIPTNTVPIDFAMFIVSPFHKMFGMVNAGISDLASKGFDWKEDSEDEEDGVELLHDANRRDE